MIVIEIEYPSLAEARERGPGDIYERARAESLRLIESPTYCERDGKGVLSVAVEEPRALVVTVSSLVSPVSDEALKKALRDAAKRGGPAPVGSDEPKPHDNDEG